MTQADLDRSAQHMIQTNTQLQANLKSLADVLENTKPHWQGQAAGAFATLVEHYSADAKKLNDSLEQIAEQVSATSKEYARQEEESNQSISQITQTLGQ
ncbi:MAG: WXG100 family type VII secretion target [Sciscionella sp.]|nr:WXG100 family type VII secretion target [Sciscionella sp.]